MSLILSSNNSRNRLNTAILIMLFVRQLFGLEGGMRMVSSFVPPATPMIRKTGIVDTRRRVVSPSIATRNTFVSSSMRYRSISSRFLAASRSSSSSVAVKDSSEARQRQQQQRPYQLVIVESPSKCQTIEKILQRYVREHDLEHDFLVTSCMGHIRNIPKKQSKDSILHDAALFPYPVMGVDLKHDLYKPTYSILPGKEKIVDELRRLVDGSEFVLLATDPDREGEAIAWSVEQELLRDRNKPFARVTFSEITPRAIRDALSNQAELDYNLIQAQETRRVLDRLAGYTVSPILWKKIAPGLSAGRVQSVGMALVVQRELERLAYVSTEYWDVGIAFPDNLNANLVSVNDQPIATGKQDFETDRSGVLRKESKHKLHLTQEKAQELVKLFNRTTVAYLREHRNEGREEDYYWKVIKVTSRKRKQSPPKPFSTSTLQQEANKRLGMSVSQTMSAAQRLYEKGLISYMRTDSTKLSQDARDATYQAVESQFGEGEAVRSIGSSSSSNDDGDNSDDDGEVAAAAKNKKKKKKKKKDAAALNVEEAHEAIRPAIIGTDQGFLSPSKLFIESEYSALMESSKKLYKLIYQRTLASHMHPQISNQTKVVIEGTSPDGDTTLQCRANGRIIVSPGYTQSWGDATTMKSSNGNNNEDDEDDATSSNNYSDRTLPPLVEGQPLDCYHLIPDGHKTQPPARYTEASFVKELEANGVGRPSTYAGTVKILRDRAYVGSPVRDGGGNNSNKKAKTARGSAIVAQRAAGGDDFTGNSGGGARAPLVPSLSAFVVYSLLHKHCPTYVDSGFTARMEERLDDIASGESGAENQRIAYLNEFYGGDNGLAAQIKQIEDDVSANEARKVHLPALFVNETSSTKTPYPKVNLLIGPWGPYLQGEEEEEEEPYDDDDGGGDDDDDDDASSKQKKKKKKLVTAPLPPGMAADVSTITPQTLHALMSTKRTDGTVLGEHPDDGRVIRLKIGRFGAYLQWGENDDEDKSTHSLPRQISAMRNLGVAGEETTAAMEEEGEEDNDNSASLSGMLGITLEEAVRYVGLPRTICTFNEKPITTSIGPYGPYLKYNSKYMSLHKDYDLFTIDAETAETLVTDGIINKKSTLGRGVIAELGEKEDSMVKIKDGRFGVYINWKKVNAKIPLEYSDNPSEIPLEEAWACIQEKDSAMAATTGRGKKKEEDAIALPPAPKRPKSAYLFFCAENRPLVVANEETKNSGSSKISLGEISKKLAGLWAEATTEDKKPFEELAQTEKQEYETKKAEWKNECQKILDNAPGSKKKTQRRKGKNSSGSSPKRPKSAYLYFCNAKREEVSKSFQSLGDISKELSRLWADTTDRTEYETLAAADKVRYEEEKENLSGTTSSRNRSSSSRLKKTTTKSRNAKTSGVTTKKARKKKSRKIVVKRTNNKKNKKQKGKQKKQASASPSAYILFCRENRPRVVDENGEKLSFGDTSKRLGEMWKSCDSETRAKFAAMSENEKEKVTGGVL